MSATNKKTDDEVDGEDLLSGDLIRIARGPFTPGENYKITGAQLKAFVLSGFTLGSLATITLGASAALSLAASSSLITAGAFAVTLTSTGTTSLTLPTSGTLATTASLSQFAATTSAQLAAVISDETGTGLLVFATNPVLTTPNIGTPSAAVLTNATGLPMTTGVTGTLAIGNGGTGQTTANAAFNALSPMTTGGDLIYGGASGAATRLANGTAGKVLQSNGTTLAPTWVTPSSGLTVGTTAVASGTTTRILYDNAGVLGEYTISGTGTVVAMATGAALVTPDIGVATATSLALGGATIGSNALAVTGTGQFSQLLKSNNYETINVAGYIAWNGRSSIDTPADGVIRVSNYAQTDFSRLQLGGTTSSFPAIKRNAAAINFRLADDSADAAITALSLTASGNLAAGGSAFGVGASTGIVGLYNGCRFGWGNGSSYSPDGATDTTLRRLASSNLVLGNVPSATPVAQILTIGEASVAGTSNNIGGANGTIQSGAGTGSGAGSSLIFQTPTTGSTGTTAQTQATRLTLTDVFAKVSSGTQFWLGNAAVTGLVAGALAALTTASVVIYDSAGQAYRVPCII